MAGQPALRTSARNLCVLCVKTGSHAAMNIRIHPTRDAANQAAADCLADWLVSSKTRNLMVAGGNTPLDLYAAVARRKLDLAHLNVFVLDEYVGVPLEEPDNCANLLSREVADAWRIPPSQYFRISSLEAEAAASVREHEERITRAGGLDAIVLGLGQNGHLGFNEPGSARDAQGRVLDLTPTSVQANKEWFRGRYAPARGVTTGLATILSARHVLLLAFGAHKVAAAKRMIEGPVNEQCPASYLRGHPDAWIFLDEPAATGLSGSL